MVFAEANPFQHNFTFFSEKTSDNDSKARGLYRHIHKCQKFFYFTPQIFCIKFFSCAFFSASKTQLRALDTVESSVPIGFSRRERVFLSSRPEKLIASQIEAFMSIFTYSF